MFYKHSLLLKWLIYIVAVTAIIGTTWITGLLNIGFSLDKSYLTYVITIFYVMAEMYIAYRVVQTSDELVDTHNTGVYLDSIRQPGFSVQNDKVYIVDEDDKTVFRELTAPNLTSHIRNLVKRSQHWSGKKPRLDQRVLIDSLGDQIFEKNSFPYLAIEIILYAGLVGTILGIIMTFYPFMDPAHPLDLTKIQANLPTVFGGVGAAFLPSLFSAVLAVFMTFNNKILLKGSNDLIDNITTISETHVVPVLEKRDEQNQ
jgi:hypothetical protein